MNSTFTHLKAIEIVTTASPCTFRLINRRVLEEERHALSVVGSAASFGELYGKKSISECTSNLEGSLGI